MSACYGGVVEGAVILNFDGGRHDIASTEAKPVVHRLETESNKKAGNFSRPRLKPYVRNYLEVVTRAEGVDQDEFCARCYILHPCHGRVYAIEATLMNYFVEVALERYRRGDISIGNLDDRLASKGGKTSKLRLAEMIRDDRCSPKELLRRAQNRYPWLSQAEAMTKMMGARLEPIVSQMQSSR